MATSTQQSETRLEAQKLFEEEARRSFSDCMDALKKVDFYKLVLSRLERGVSIEDEVPEVKNYRADEVKQVVLMLSNKAAATAKDVWKLSDRYASCFNTTIRYSLPDGELIPQYDIEHVSQTDAGQVKIQIKTWRLKVDVQIVGTDEALEKTWSAMSMAAMFAKG